MVPAEKIPDYIELDLWIDENMSGKLLTAEEAVALMFIHIEKRYEPEHLIVTSETESFTHSKVIVSKWK